MPLQPYSPSIPATGQGTADPDGAESGSCSGKPCTNPRRPESEPGGGVQRRETQSKPREEGVSWLPLASQPACSDAGRVFCGPARPWPGGNGTAALQEKAELTLAETDLEAMCINQTGAGSLQLPWSHAGSCRRC